MLIVVLMVVFVILYHSKPGGQPGKAPSHNTLLEITWTVIPVGIVMYIFYQGFVGFMDIRHGPPSGYDINVVARKWSWAFTYPNGVTDSTLHIPVDEPVRLTMRSEDVIHSLFIPAFRQKTDVVPGRYTYMWFRAPKPGDYDLLCAEYCGTGHSDMSSKVMVQSHAELDAWLKEAGDVLKNNPPVGGRENPLSAVRLQCVPFAGRDARGGSHLQRNLGRNAPFQQCPAARGRRRLRSRIRS